MLPYHRVLLLDGYGFGKGITEQSDNRGQNFYNAEYHKVQISPQGRTLGKTAIT